MCFLRSRVRWNWSGRRRTSSARHRTGKGIYPALLTSLVKGAGKPTRLRWINPAYTDPGEPCRDLDELRRT